MDIIINTLALKSNMTFIPIECLENRWDFLYQRKRLRLPVLKKFLEIRVDGITQ